MTKIKYKIKNLGIWRDGSDGKALAVKAWELGWILEPWKSQVGVVARVYPGDRTPGSKLTSQNGEIPLPQYVRREVIREDTLYHAHIP